MIATTALELRAGARLLSLGSHCTHQPAAIASALLVEMALVNQPLQRYSLVKHCLQVAAFSAQAKIGYLPQDPRTGEDQGTALDRILSARDLDQIAHSYDAGRTRDVYY